MCQVAAAAESLQCLPARQLTNFGRIPCQWMPCTHAQKARRALAPVALQPSPATHHWHIFRIPLGQTSLTTISAGKSEYAARQLASFALRVVPAFVAAPLPFAAITVADEGDYKGDLANYERLHRLAGIAGLDAGSARFRAGRGNLKRPRRYDTTGACSARATWPPTTASKPARPRARSTIASEPKANTTTNPSSHWPDAESTCCGLSTATRPSIGLAANRTQGCVVILWRFIVAYRWQYVASGVRPS